MGDLTQHFNRSEFADRRTGEVRLPPCRLLVILELLRSISGEPLRIVSGYRSVATNRAVGGAANSRHLQGDAVDIPPGRCDEALARELGATGIGLSGPWAVHLDVRPGPVTVWHY